MQNLPTSVLGDSLSQEGTKEWTTQEWLKTKREFKFKFKFTLWARGCWNTNSTPRVGGPVQEAENLFLTSKFWPILAQIGQIKTIQNPPWAQECVSFAYNLTIFHICTAWNQMSHRVTYIIICMMMWHIIILYIILYSRNHVIKTYHIWTKHTLFRRRGGGGSPRRWINNCDPM